MKREKQVIGLLQETERKRPIRNFFKRIKDESSKKNRTKGQIATGIGIACATVLSLGVVTAPLGIALLAIGSAIFGGKAIFHARKTKKDLDNTDNQMYI